MYGCNIGQETFLEDKALVAQNSSTTQTLYHANIFSCTSITILPPEGFVTCPQTTLKCVCKQCEDNFPGEVPMLCRHKSKAGIVFSLCSNKQNHFYPYSWSETVEISPCLFSKPSFSERLLPSQSLLTPIHKHMDHALQ